MYNKSKMGRPKRGSNDSEFLKGIVEAKKAGRPVSQAAIDRASQILQEIQKNNKKFMTGR